MRVRFNHAPLNGGGLGGGGGGGGGGRNETTQLKTCQKSKILAMVRFLHATGNSSTEINKEITRLRNTRYTASQG